MKIRLFIFVFLASVQVVFSQKDTSRSYETKNLEEVHLYADEIFRINISTTSGNEVILRSHSEGEYFDDIDLKVEQLEKKLIFSSQFEELKQNGYDKLSAHKVFSVELTVEVPEGLNVYVKSNIASVTGTGIYENLQIELRTGSCKLFNFSGNALINTYSGGVDVNIPNAVINAASRRGEVDAPSLTHGTHRVEIQSISGDIRVREN